MVKVMKTVSAVLGIMICLALGGLGYAFYTSGEKPQEADESAQATSFTPAVTNVAQVVTPTSADIGGIALGQPEGSTIDHMVPQGALVYITVQGGGEPDRVLIVDLMKRRVVGHMALGSMGGAPQKSKP